LYFSFSNKCCSLQLSKKTGKINVSTKILNMTTVFNIDKNKKCAAHQILEFISEGSCDTEDSSNDSK